MTSLGLSSYALAISAAAMLAGCGGSQQFAEPSGTSPTNAAANKAEASSKRDSVLVYAAGKGTSYVLSYADGHLVGTINQGAVAACSDKNGNVFLIGSAGAVEYRHGATSPKQTLAVPGYAAACAADPTTGNLAVLFFGSSGNVAIFPNASGTPTVYRANIYPAFCGYDSHGNLFVDGLNSSQGFAMTELPQGSAGFVPITISPNITQMPAQVQWDGSYITVEGLASLDDGNGTTIYRLQTSGSGATVVGKTRFRKAGRAVGQSWMHNQEILLPFGTRVDEGYARRVGFWRYPSGGRPTTVFKNFAAFADLTGVTLSVAPH